MEEYVQKLAVVEPLEAFSTMSVDRMDESVNQPEVRLLRFEHILWLILLVDDQ